MIMVSIPLPGIEPVYEATLMAINEGYKKIADTAFYGCKNLKTVYYSDTWIAKDKIFIPG